MKSTGIKDIVFDEIKILAERHGVEKVILFGSRARGDYLRNSDIDLAVSGGGTSLLLHWMWKRRPPRCCFMMWLIWERK